MQFSPCQSSPAIVARGMSFLKTSSFKCFSCTCFSCSWEADDLPDIIARGYDCQITMEVLSIINFDAL